MLWTLACPTNVLCKLSYCACSSLHSSGKNNVQTIFLHNMQDLVAHQLGTELLLSWGLSESLNTGQGLSSTILRGTEVPEPTFSLLAGKRTLQYNQAKLISTFYCSCQRPTCSSWSHLLGLASPTPTHPLTSPNWMMLS